MSISQATPMSLLSLVAATLLLSLGIAAGAAEPAKAQARAGDTYEWSATLAMEPGTRITFVSPKRADRYEASLRHYNDVG